MEIFRLCSISPPRIARTVHSHLCRRLDDDPIWIPQQNIRDENSLLGQSSRSVIGSIATNGGHSDQQLQCIVAKSNATLSYVFYTEQTQQVEETETNIVIPVGVKSFFLRVETDLWRCLAIHQTDAERDEPHWWKRSFIGGFLYIHSQWYSTIDEFSAWSSFWVLLPFSVLI